MHLGAEPAIVVPNLAGWRRERLPSIPDAPYLTLAPDWICEVISPSTGRFDRAEKMPLYAAEKVRYAWLVDPLQHTLEVLRNEEGRWLLLATFAGDAKVRAEPFEAIELELSALWADVEASSR